MSTFIYLFKDTTIASVNHMPNSLTVDSISTNTSGIIKVLFIVAPMYLVTSWTCTLRSSNTDTRSPRMMVILEDALPFLWQELLRHLACPPYRRSLVLGVFGTSLTYHRMGRITVRAYSDIARGLPLITLIFFVYYAMPR